LFCLCVDGDREWTTGDAVGARRTTQQSEVIDKRRGARVSDPLANSSSQEKDEHHRRGDPKRPVQVRVALEHVEEVRARVEGGPAARQHGRRVDVEELRVKRNGPEKSLAAAAARGRAPGRHGGRQAPGRGVVGLAAAGGGGLVEVGVVELEVLPEVGVAEVAIVVDVHDGVVPGTGHCDRDLASRKPSSPAMELSISGPSWNWP
jgi:hypothetical protein